jgi:hypothetical protein
MISLAVQFAELTLPAQCEMQFARVAVRRALNELNVALRDLVVFSLVSDLSGTPVANRVTIAFGAAATGTADLFTNTDGSRIIRLDSAADWDIQKQGWQRHGTVSLETWLWHNCGHLATSEHATDPQSIMAAIPLTATYLRRADRLLLREAFANLP